MEGVRDQASPTAGRRGRLAGLWAAGLLCSLACASLCPGPRAQAPPPPLSQQVTHLASPVAARSGPALQQTAAQQVTPPEELPRPAQLGPAPLAPARVALPKAVPVNLDTVFRLAESQNVQIKLAREQLQEAYAAQAVADKSWLPDVFVGPSYFRHEGGIANEDGSLTRSSFGSLFAGMELNSRLDLHEAVYRKVDAERKVWQQKGAVSRMTSENLLDAATTYVDLLTAHTAEVIGGEVLKNLDRLLDQAKKRAATDPGARVEVDRVAAEIAAERQLLRKAREGAGSASAKLAYLLGVDPCSELVPTDPKLVPLRFVDASRLCCDLVAQAVATGPGVREMEGLLGVINGAMEKAKGPGKYLPVFELRMAEGFFGTGPGDSMASDNRLDVGISARWNLSGFVTAGDRQRLAQSKLSQAHLSYQDLRARLAMGVQQAREASLSNGDQIREAEEQIQSARATYKLSQLRLNENIKGASASEVLQAIRALGLAQLNYLQAVRDFDKAQLRLMVLMGGAVGPGTHP